jgi:hypothetical protein
MGLAHLSQFLITIWCHGAIVLRKSARKFLLFKHMDPELFEACKEINHVSMSFQHGHRVIAPAINPPAASVRFDSCPPFSRFSRCLIAASHRYFPSSSALGIRRCGGRLVRGPRTGNDPHNHTLHSAGECRFVFACCSRCSSIHACNGRSHRWKLVMPNHCAVRS